MVSKMNIMAIFPKRIGMPIDFAIKIFILPKTFKRMETQICIERYANDSSPHFSNHHLGFTISRISGDF